MALLRSGFVVAFFTFISRIFGLARELFIASLFGSGMIADSVNVAFKLPNLFRRIFGEGALSSVFVPIFNEKLAVSKDHARRFSSEIFSLLMITLLILVVIMQIFMPYLMYVIAPGFQENLEKFDLTVLLCRITIPYMIFVSATALFGGMLNSIGRFAAFAFSPVILNLVIIFCTEILGSYTNLAVGVCISIIIAGALQVLFMVYYLKKAKLTFPLVFRGFDSDVKKFLKKMGPATISSGIVQFNLFISQSIASFIPGAVSILSYADRIYQFPLSLIGISFGTILLPELSKLYKNQEFVKANSTQNYAIQAAFALSIPAAIGIIVLSLPIIHIIYERGAFTSEDTIKTAEAISAFALGLPAFVLAKILTPIFFANHDTSTPMKVTIYSLTANTILNILLMFSFQHVGIAIGSSIASWYSVYLLYNYAHKQGKCTITKETKFVCLKVIVSSALMVLAIKIMEFYLGKFLYVNAVLVKMLTLTTIISFGALVFFITSYFFGLHKILLKKAKHHE